MKLHDKTDAELRAEKAAILREQSRRRKAAKPKRRKAVHKDEAKRAAAYAAFRVEHQACWICGRTMYDKPAWWNGPFLIERMHIVNKPRVEDVRAIIAGCSLCHRMQHGEKFAAFGECEPLTVRSLLTLKAAHDPDNYDPEFLQRHSIRQLPFNQ